MWWRWYIRWILEYSSWIRISRIHNAPTQVKYYIFNTVIILYIYIPIFTFYVSVKRWTLVSIMLKIQMLEHIVTDDSVADEERVEREEREEQLNDEWVLLLHLLTGLFKCQLISSEFTRLNAFNINQFSSVKFLLFLWSIIVYLVIRARGYMQPIIIVINMYSNAKIMHLWHHGNGFSKEQPQTGCIWFHFTLSLSFAFPNN